MTSPFALALAFVLAPPVAEPGASGPPVAMSGTRELLDEKITLNLQKADLGQVLERLATLLGKTLILQPGIEGTVTLDVRETSVSDVLTGLQTSHGLSIRLEGDRMYVTKAGEKPPARPGKSNDDGSNAAFLADTSLPRRLASEKPKRFAGSFEFREADAGGSAVWEIGGIPGTVTLPGCAGPIPVVLLPGDAFDGVPRLVFAPARGAAAPARIAAPGARVQLPDCSSPLSIRAVETTDGIPKAIPVSQPEPYELTARILEAGAGGDEVLSAARARLTGASTLETRAAIPGVPLGQGIRMSFAVVAAGDDDALLACSVSVTRDVEPAPGDPPVTIRIARAEESLRLDYGKPARITVSPVYGGGRSALVLEITLGRAPAKR